MKQMGRGLMVAALAAAMLVWGPEASGQDKKTDAKKTPPPRTLKHLDGQMIVLVANGSGGSTSTSDSLWTVSREEHVPLVVQTVHWCRYGESMRDHNDHEAHFAGAARIAGWVETLRKDCPKSPIFLVGHSSGTRVVLAASEMVPARSLERVILLAPSVSCNYDLTTALRAARDGIVSYYSNLDTVLEIAEDYLGTADGQRTACAGRVGFRVPRDKAGKAPEAYAKFRQFHWEESMGGHGGHYSGTRESFMRRTLLPSLFVSEAVVTSKSDK